MRIDWTWMRIWGVALFVGTSAPWYAAADLAAPGAYYHIAQQHPEASDENPGTAGRPFKTIEGGLTALSGVLQPGDTVWIHDGLYRPPTLVIGAGTAEPPQLFRFPSGESYARMTSILAYPGQKPVINQAEVIEAWTPFRDAIWSAPVRGPNRRHFPVLFADGKPLQQIGGTVRRSPQHWRGRKGDSLEDLEPGSFFFDEAERTLYAWLEDGGDPRERQTEVFSDHMFRFGLGLEYVRLSGLTFRMTSVSFAASRSILENIDQAWAPFAGCFLGGEFNTVVNSRFNYNGNNGMGGRGRGHRILDSETNHNNWRNWSPGWHAGGIKFIPNWHDIVIHGHTAAYNQGSGIWFDAFASNVTIENCRVYRNTGNGIHYEIATRGVIKNNLIYENGHRGVYLANSSYSAVLHNVLYRNGMSGVAATGITRGGGVHGRGEGRFMSSGYNVVWGNLFVDNCWDGSRDLERFAGWGERPELIMPSERAGNEGNISDYNVFFRSGPRGERLDSLRFGRDWSVNFARGLDDWREKTEWDENSIMADPKFVDAEAYDFRLADDSPALWMVRELDQSVRSTFDNVPRVRIGVHSAGPFEGDFEELERLRETPVMDQYRLFPLAPRDGRTGAGVQTLLRFAVSMLNNHRALVGVGQTGFRVLEIPFLRDGRNDGIALDQPHPATVFPLGASVRKLHLLFSIENATPGTPVLEALIPRGDGETVRLQWTLSETGEWRMLPEPGVEVRHGHTGTAPRVSKDPPEATVWVATWTNDNEWLPLEQIEFKLLDPAAQVVVMGVTGET